MLKRRNLIAIFVGTVVGLLAIATTAEFGYCAFRNMIEPGQWHIPGWDTYQSFTPGPMLELKHKAIFLRMCKVFLDQGFVLLAVPILISLAFAKLYEMGSKNRQLYCLSRSFVVTVCCVSAVALLWAISASLYDTEAPKVLEGQILYAYHAFLFLFVCAFFSLIAPAFWAVVYFRFWIYGGLKQVEGSVEAMDPKTLLGTE